MKLTKEQRRSMSAAISELLAGNVSDDVFGICHNLDTVVVQARKFVDTYEFVAKHSVNWPGRTGLTVRDGWCAYPILKEFDADGNRMPLWEGSQLAQRRDLLEYLLSKVA